MSLSSSDAIRFADDELSRKWNKLRRRCASFKASPAAFVDDRLLRHHHRHDCDASSAVLIEHPMRATVIPATVPAARRSLFVPLDDPFDDRWMPPPPPPPSTHSGRRASSIDWEFSAEHFDNILSLGPPPAAAANGAGEKLQYYERTTEVRKFSSVGSERGTRLAREFKIPGLAAFKSASVRLPGHKSTINEVQQLLRNKFNQIQTGMRKKKALSVHDVFPESPTFYVPAPAPNPDSPAPSPPCARTNGCHNHHNSKPPPPKSRSSSKDRKQEKKRPRSIASSPLRNICWSRSKSVEPKEISAPVPPVRPARHRIVRSHSPPARDVVQPQYRPINGHNGHNGLLNGHHQPKPEAPVVGRRELRQKQQQASQDGSHRRSASGDSDESQYCTLPRNGARTWTIRQAKFSKGGGKALGFSIVGGADSPVKNVYVKTIYPHGQAAELGTIREGDEILSVNGVPFQGLTHQEAINVFKSIKSGEVVVVVGRKCPPPTLMGRKST